MATFYGIRILSIYLYLCIPTCIYILIHNFTEVYVMDSLYVAFIIFVIFVTACILRLFQLVLEMQDQMEERDEAMKYLFRMFRKEKNNGRKTTDSRRKSS